MTVLDSIGIVMRVMVGLDICVVELSGTEIIESVISRRITIDESYGFRALGDGWAVSPWLSV